MTPLVTGAVLAAALTHAGWNALAHRIKDRLVVFTLIVGGASVIGGLMAPFVPVPAAGAWPYLITSAVLHVGYHALLLRSFSLGDFGQVYPIARGTAPLVVTAAAALFVDERVSGGQLAGVVVASAGLVGLAVWGVLPLGRRAEEATRPHWPAVAAALATGLSISAYTVIDGMGVRAGGTAAGYIAWLMILEGIPLVLYAIYVRRAALWPQLRPYAGRGLLGAAMAVTAYGLVLWAQTRAPLAPIAALRESSIIVGAAIGALFFKERFGGPRIAAAVLMVAGIGLMLTAG
ncbi:EamA family transporter [Streptomyces sp. NPDC006540]|uniref:EamA family transporter n=1 Tax=Streptomyces sp. NPDC006540 TaxID=3155353 RepID=UPI0033AB8D8C